MKWILSLCVSFLGFSVMANDRPPNVVFIMADDLGWADLGCYGSRYHKTPQLDALAKSGARFTQAYAGSTVCSPTRAAIMTGRHPARVGITDWLPGRPDRPDQPLNRPALVNDLPADLPTLPGLLKKAGYRTGLVGKWHLGGKEATPQSRGFDVNIAGDETGTALSYFAPFKAAKGDRFMPGLENAPEGEYLTDRLTAEANKFITESKDKPFFLYLAHYAPHTPLKAKPEKLAKYKAGGPGQQGNPNYAAMIESLDDGIGSVLAKLDELKLADNTIVVFTSDNGGLATLENMPAPPTINSPLREGKGHLYEGGIRVPLIVRWPGVSKAGQTVETPVSCLDFLPTFLAAAGQKVETLVDGIDIRTVFAGGKLPRDTMAWHYPHYSNQTARPGGAIRVGDYKLIEFFDLNRLELFDLKKDPGEGRNLSAEKPDVVKDLHARLVAWRKEVGARMMTPNPAYTPNPPDKQGIIRMPARWAEVHGVTLRYEPLPHKNTLGYWINEKEWASWEFTVLTPGKYVVEVLQGCGTGNGGSSVNVEVAGQTLNFIVEDTGGFQAFKPREIGTVTIDKAGRHTLAIKPQKKAAAAVMDVRLVSLKPLVEKK